MLGEKLSGDLFTPEDMDLFETLASQCALAVENAGSYKLIDDLNKNLEKRWKKGPWLFKRLSLKKNELRNN